jgi:hypothetical protein
VRYYDGEVDFEETSKRQSTASARIDDEIPREVSGFCRN